MSSTTKSQESDSRKILIQTWVDRELADWVQENFDRGFRSQYLSLCLQNLRMLVEEGKMPPPSEYARVSSMVTVAEIIEAGSDSGSVSS